jgi:1,2-diacylglycerol 3-beta-galactosyltransferase
VAKTKRILILTNDTGFGHRSAAKALGAALQKKHSGECVVEIVNPLDDERAPALLRDGQTDYDKMVREMPDRYKLRYEFSDAAVPNAIIESAVTVLLYNILRDLIDRFKPDVIISTHSMYAAPASAVISINRLNLPYIVVVTDLTSVHRMWFNNSADLILVPTQAARMQAQELGILDERVHITGIPVDPEVIEETRQPEEIRRELGWHPEMKTVLMVGSKRIKGMEEVIRVFNHSALDIQLVVIAGGDNSLYGFLKQTDWHGIVHVFNYVANMPAMLRAADIVVSKAGGLIITESLAFGRPLLMIDVTPGQEEGNADYVIKNGAGLLASTSVDALEHLFHWIHDPTLLAEYQQRARDLGRPYSAYSISELVWEVANREIYDSSQISSHMLSKLLDLLTSYGIRSQEGAADDRLNHL